MTVQFVMNISLLYEHCSPMIIDYSASRGFSHWQHHFCTHPMTSTSSNSALLTFHERVDTITIQREASLYEGSRNV